MIILNPEALLRSARKRRDAASWLIEWRRAVEAAQWQSLIDVRVDYPSADGVKVKSDAIVTVFNVKGNTYRLLTFVHYARQAVLVIELLTHEQYDRDFWKERL